MHGITFPAGPAAAYAPATSLHPTPERDADARLRAAHEALRAGRHAEALASFDHVIDREPRHGLARAGRAVCLAEMGHGDAAALELAQTLEGDAGARLALDLARAAVKAGNLPLAVDLACVAATASPRLAEAALQDPSLAGVRDHPLFAAAFLTA